MEEACHDSEPGRPPQSEPRVLRTSGSALSSYRAAVRKEAPRAVPAGGCIRVHGGREVKCHPTATASVAIGPCGQKRGATREVL